MRESRPRLVVHYRTLEEKEPFRDWFQGLMDERGKRAIIDRLKRVQLGSLGHCDDVGEGVWGLKIDVGPGYRVYFGQHGMVVVVLLCGGEKHRQRRDVALARAYWRDYKYRKSKGN